MNGPGKLLLRMLLAPAVLMALCCYIFGLVIAWVTDPRYSHYAAISTVERAIKLLIPLSGKKDDKWR